MIPTPTFFLILIALDYGFQMRYHLFLNSIRKMVTTTKVFSRKLAVKFQSSTTVFFINLSKNGWDNLSKNLKKYLGMYVKKR